jgi:hypothetical protein
LLTRAAKCAQGDAERLIKDAGVARQRAATRKVAEGAMDRAARGETLSFASGEFTSDHRTERERTFALTFTTTYAGASARAPARAAVDDTDEEARQMRAAIAASLGVPRGPAVRWEATRSSTLCVRLPPAAPPSVSLSHRRGALP